MGALHIYCQPFVALSSMAIPMQMALEWVMNTVNETLERQLDASQALRPLTDLIEEIVREYPDPSVLATEEARRILLTHTGKRIDPRFVWWHQFEGTSASSSTSFTGWQHRGPPSKSMHLTELVVHRFDAAFQQAPDQLAVYGGFYRQGPQALQFDTHNEVGMLGSDVQSDLWALDFAVAYRAKVEHFLTTQRQHFRVLAKICLLGHIAEALAAARITRDDGERLRAMVADGLPADQLPTLATLERDSTTSTLTLSRYVLDPADGGCIYSLEAADGRVVLYLPWAGEALRAFGSALAMACWLREHLQDSQKLDAFKAAAYGDARDPARTHAVATHLQGIASSASEQAALVLLNYLKRPITQDMFTYLIGLVARELRETASLMTNNADLRNAIWRGYLAAFLKVFGGFAPLGWPMSLALLGASVAKVGLDVQAAARAGDDQSRREALRMAILDSVLAAFNMVDLGFQSSFASLARPAAPHESGVSLEHWQVAQPAQLPLEGQESNVLLTGEVGQAGRLRGVGVSDDGICWITLNGLSFHVRYSHELSCWLIVPNNNPYAFGPLLPVRLNANGQWELLVAPGLRGGGSSPIADVADIGSPFWDVYATADGTQSSRLSAGALRRQKKLLETWMIPTLAADKRPDLDGNGLDCVMVHGLPEYSYRYQREYYNSLIEYYTSDESRVNEVLRHGVYHYGDEDSYLGNLADSLDRLPKSNAVNLYRGGHVSRGTGGRLYRSGHLKVGDVLVNSDLTSFTENPYKATDFASQVTGQGSATARTFDDSSVIFGLPAGHYHDGTPVSAFSLYWDEAETLFLPGHYFRIDKIEQVHGVDYRFILVTLGQVSKTAEGAVYDLRTGLAFDLAAYRARIRTPALAQRFFPQ